VSAALTALSAVTFALGIAAGNGPRLITATRGAAPSLAATPRPSPLHTSDGRNHHHVSRQRPGPPPG
jgi:hypothetical protein